MGNKQNLSLTNKKLQILDEMMNLRSSDLWDKDCIMNSLRNTFLLDKARYLGMKHNLEGSKLLQGKPGKHLNLRNFDKFLLDTKNTLVVVRSNTIQPDTKMNLKMTKGLAHLK